MVYKPYYSVIFEYSYDNLQLIKTPNDTTRIISINFNTNFFLKLPKSIIVFLTSNIGPTTRNPITEFIENCFKKLLAIKASDVEHTESKKANAIIIKSEILLSFEIYILLFNDTTF